MFRIALRHAQVFILAMSVTLNIALASWASMHLQQPHEAPARRQLTVGAIAPTVHGRDLKGQPVAFGFSQKPTLLYVLSPDCAWCARNTGNMAALWRARSSEYNFVGLSIREAGLQAYLSAHPLPFPVYVADRTTMDAFGLGPTPSTLVIGTKGAVLQHWNGAFGKGRDGFFGVDLPGLDVEPGAGK